MSIIFSVFKSTNNAMQNELNLHKTKKLLDYYGIAYQEAQGSYKGTLEQSLIVDLSHLSVIKSIANRFDQESILLIDSASQASLMFQSGELLDLGKFKHVSDKMALISDAWTLVNGKYYMAS